MPKLVTKVGYIRAKSATRYLRYIATRKGVQKQLQGEKTKKQQELIDVLLQDFPESKKLREYEEYMAVPTAANASELIDSIIDSNEKDIEPTGKYMEYIALRPRAEIHNGHGLFGSEETVDFKKQMNELRKHEGPVWTLIFSLEREEATRVKLDNSQAWRKLIISHQTEIADIFKIPQKNFHWYAAFHDESYHPHIHMMCWSDDPKHGYLKQVGVHKIRSILTNDIFGNDFKTLYIEKDIAYKEIVAKARNELFELTRKINQEPYFDPVITEKMLKLSKDIAAVDGKKVYGYLPKRIKRQVDEIVDELSKREEIAKCYDTWNELKDSVDAYYKDTPRESAPLSEQKEFKAIKNAVIQEAIRINEGSIVYPGLHVSDEFYLGVSILQNSKSEEAVQQAMEHFKKAAEQGDMRASTVIKHYSRYPNPSLLLSSFRLVASFTSIFRSQLPPANPKGDRADSIRRQYLMEKRLALGHKIDDHEPEVTYNTKQAYEQSM